MILTKPGANSKPALRVQNDFAVGTISPNGEAVLLVPGMLLPISMVLFTVAWFTQRGFIQIGRRRPTPRLTNGVRKKDG